MTTLLVLIVLCVLLAIMSPVFLTGGNLINILQQVTVNGVPGSRDFHRYLYRRYRHFGRFHPGSGRYHHG